MRPRTLDEFAGQEHIVGPGRLLRRAIQADQLSSLIFYGPPGTGKTTLAMVIANTTESHFVTMNAVLAGVKDLREAIATAKEYRGMYAKRTILFVDEVHRWNKAQQDALLPWVENGTIILIGATTENPYFAVNPPLVSRSRVFQLKPLTERDLYQIARHTLEDEERGYGTWQIDIHPQALDHLVDVANGDARSLLNALELAVETTPPNEEGTIVVDMAVAEESIQQRAVLYDKEGDVHYDTISAFIKSLRGSDPDAALYWLARMVYAGEDPRFIFRRMLILASEDIGLADPNAIAVVNACAQAFERVGLPEGRFHLAQATLYLANAAKSNSIMGFFDALAAVEAEREAEVPTHLKDGSRDKEGFGHGEGYLYPHAYRDHWIAQQYLPDPLQGRVFYEPSTQGYEAQIEVQVARRKEAQLAAMIEGREGQSPLEILTFSPQDRGLDRWLQRVVSGESTQLSKIRDRVFEPLNVQRHHLLLDLNAGSGLCTWEALRQAPEGGVWALAQDEETAVALEQQASRLPPLRQPMVLVGTLSEIPELLALRGEDNIRFDAIVGRNALTRIPDKPRAIENLRGLIRQTGQISLAEVVPRHTQRLYALLKNELPDTLCQDLRQAEEKIYAAPNDPMVNWDVDDLVQAFQEQGFAVTTRVEEQTSQMRITAGMLDRWFTADERGERATYREHLQSHLSETQVDRVEALFHRKLLDQTVTWKTLVAFLVAQITPA
jgi:putative ATPase